MSDGVIVLGSKVKDVVSGYTGIAVARYDYLNGCERYEVGGADKDGKPESFIFDVQQLELVDAPVITPKRIVGRKVVEGTGGPRDNTPVPR